MARIPYKDASDLAPEDRDLLQRPINLFRAMVNSPGGFRAFMGLADFTRYQGKLDPRLRELAILQVGYTTSAPYEFSHHVPFARQFGCSDDDIGAVAKDTAGEPTHLSAVDRAVLQAARDMTLDLRMG